MGSLDQKPAQNLGSLAALYVLEASQVAVMPQLDGMQYQGNILLRSGASWQPIGFTHQSAQPVIRKKENQHGVYYEATLSGKLPSDSAVKLKAMHDMHRLLLLFRDQEGTYKVLGSPENPVKGRFTHTAPSQLRGYKGYSFEFTYKGLLPAVFYSGTLDATITLQNAIFSTEGPHLLTTEGPYIQFT